MQSGWVQDAEHFESKRNKDTAWQGPRAAARANGHASLPLSQAARNGMGIAQAAQGSVPGPANQPARWLPDETDELDPEDIFEVSIRSCWQSGAAAKGRAIVDTYHGQREDPHYTAQSPPDYHALIWTI